MWIIELQYSQQITNPKYVQTISTLSVGWLNVDWSVRACTCSQRKSFLAKTQLCMGISPLCFVLWFDMYISLFSCSHENVKYDLNWRKKITTCTKTFPFLEKKLPVFFCFCFLTFRQCLFPSAQLLGKKAPKCNIWLIVWISPDIWMETVRKCFHL